MDPDRPRRPRPYARRSQADRMQDVETALNALADDPDIRAAMTPAGYDRDGVAGGRALLTAVQQAGKARRTAADRRGGLTAEQKAALDAANTLYKPLAGTARTLFRRSPPDLAALRLTGRHGGSLPERVERLRAFADAARDPARLPRFTAVGVPERQFTALTEALDAVALKAGAQDQGSARAQDASTSKTDAFAALDEWMLTMHGHARVRLGGREQLLEALGLKPR